MAQVTELKVYALMGGLYGRSFAGKSLEGGAPISVTINEEDMRLVRPRALRVLWWALVGVLWL
jgi:hypothetical protein